MYVDVDDPSGRWNAWTHFSLRLIKSGDQLIAGSATDGATILGDPSAGNDPTNPSVLLRRDFKLTAAVPGG